MLTVRASILHYVQFLLVITLLCIHSAADNLERSIAHGYDFAQYQVKNTLDHLDETDTLLPKVTDPETGTWKTRTRMSYSPPLKRWRNCLPKKPAASSPRYRSV
jgi:hypothetical protein